jgi:hypothetical protein
MGGMGRVLFPTSRSRVASNGQSQRMYTCSWTRSHRYQQGVGLGHVIRIDLEICAGIPKITGSNPSGGSDLAFRSDLLLTARGGST